MRGRQRVSIVFMGICLPVILKSYKGHFFLGSLHGLKYTVSVCLYLKPIDTATYGNDLSWIFRLMPVKALGFPLLRILAMYEAENSKICNFCAFWPLIQLRKHLFIVTELLAKTSRSCYFLLFSPHT